MLVAFVLMKTEPAHIDDVVKALVEMEIVEEMHSLAGDYDLIQGEGRRLRSSGAPGRRSDSARAASARDQDAYRFRRVQRAEIAQQLMQLRDHFAREQLLSSERLPYFDIAIVRNDQDLDHVNRPLES